MDVDELGGVEEEVVSTRPEGAVANEEPPISVSMGTQSWHSGVPQVRVFEKRNFVRLVKCDRVR